MFITRFTRTDKDKTAEDYLYHTEQEAKDHLMLFGDDKDDVAKPTSLAWDVNLVGLPTSTYVNTHSWDE